MTRCSSLSSVLLPPPADNTGKGKERKRKRKGGRGRKKKGRKNTKPRGKNDKNVQHHLRQAVAKHANCVQAFFLLVGICAKEAVLTALKEGKTFTVDVGTMPWNQAFYDRIFKQYSDRIDTKTSSFLKTWRMNALSSKYEKAFELANDWFRNDALSRSALHRISGSVSKQMATNFQTTLVKCGVSCCAKLKDVKNGDSICVQLRSALTPFKGANTDEFSSVFEDDEDGEAIQADDREWETLLRKVVQACVLIEKEGKR